MTYLMNQLNSNKRYSNISCDSYFNSNCPRKIATETYLQHVD